MSHPDRPPSRNQSALFGFLRWAGVLVLLFVLVSAGYYLYVDVINRPPAEVYVAQRGTAVSAVYGTVTINANYALTLFSQNAGTIHFYSLGTIVNQNGAPVKKDQKLATIVDEIGARQLNQAKTDYEAALARQKNGPPTTGILKSAQDSLAAYNKLPPNGVPRIVREAAQNDVTRLQSAVDNEKLELQHVVDATAGVMKASEDQLRRTEIVAPFDGILTQGFFNENSYVLPNQPVFTVASSGTYVSGQVNEEDVGQLRPGMKAEIRLYAFSNTTFNATLAQVLPSPDPNSSRYTVTLSLDQPPDNLMYGETGEMNIILGRKNNTLIVPARALNIDQVLIVADGVVEQRTVKIGFKSLEFCEILEGIGEGDEVIVADQDAFKPGERVRPIKINQTKK